jgi:hypothetical protein
MAFDGVCDSVVVRVRIESVGNPVTIGIGTVRGVSALDSIGDAVPVTVLVEVVWPAIGVTVLAGGADATLIEVKGVVETVAILVTTTWDCLGNAVRVSIEALHSIEEAVIVAVRVQVVRRAVSVTIGKRCFEAVGRAGSRHTGTIGIERVIETVAVVVLADRYCVGDAIAVAVVTLGRVGKAISVGVEVQVVRQPVTIGVDFARQGVTDPVCTRVDAADRIGIRVVGNPISIVVHRAIGPTALLLIGDAVRIVIEVDVVAEPVSIAIRKVTGLIDRADLKPRAILIRKTFDTGAAWNGSIAESHAESRASAVERTGTHVVHAEDARGSCGSARSVADG